VGGHLGFIDTIEVPASGVAERTCIIALCRDLAEARRYTCLEEYG
jgi:hypothetical protein